MNEELQRRAIEAVARAVHQLERRPLYGWDSVQSDEKIAYLMLGQVAADAALSVVADWCDEQRNRAIDEAGYTWTEALNRVAGACRPAGEEA